ncbi:hypothetical protein IJJ97_03365, partial [bacterium]|nr:hypothetical protein [bacterium]
MEGIVDVAVADGFVGNIILKTAEGTGGLVTKLIKQHIGKNPISMLGAMLMKGVFKKLKKEMDHSEYGGALLFGIDGISIKVHGRAKYDAVENAIKLAERMIKKDIIKLFAEDMAEENISSLALMDSESAAIYGKRVLGELPAEFVSVYDNSETYSTISYQGKPMKVSALQFAGVFKAMQNENVGVPAYVIVDPVNYTAEYVVTEKPMKYVPSGVFGHKLRRHIHKAYPTYIQGNTFFEID